MALGHGIVGYGAWLVYEYVHRCFGYSAEQACIEVTKDVCILYRYTPNTITYTVSYGHLRYKEIRVKDENELSLLGKVWPACPPRGSW